MLSSRFRGDGRCRTPGDGGSRWLARLCGLVLAVGVGCVIAATPVPAWADPAADAKVSSDPADGDIGAGDGADLGTAPNRTGEGQRQDSAPHANPAGDGPSESEMNVGDGGPEVTIRYSGGYTGDDPGGDPEPPLDHVDTTPAGSDSAPAAAPDAQEVVEVTTDAPAVSTPVVPDADAAVVVVPDEYVGRDTSGTDSQRTLPLDTGFDLFANDGPSAAEVFGARGGPSVTTSSPRALNAPVVTAAPDRPADEALTAPVGLLGAASALLSGVLDVLFVPTPGDLPPDSPIVWAVLGLVRRQFNGTTGGTTLNADPRQTSRPLGGDAQTFTLVSDRYAYVLDRDTNTMTVVDVATNEIVEFREYPDQLVGTPVVSPDGSRVFVTTAQNGGVYSVPATFGESIDIDDATVQSEPIIAGGHGGPNDYYVPDGVLAFSEDGTLLFVSRTHAHIVGGLFMPADGDVVVVGNDPSDPATYLKVIGGTVGV